MDDVALMAVVESFGHADDDFPYYVFVPDPLRDVSVVKILARYILHDNVEVRRIVIHFVYLDYILMVQTKEYITFVLQKVPGIILPILNSLLGAKGTS